MHWDLEQSAATGTEVGICDSTYLPVVGRFDFESHWCKVKISQNTVPILILRFHIFWNLQCLLCKLLDGFDVKLDWYTNTLPWFTNFKSLFLNVNFSLIYYDIMNENTIISQGCNIRFQKNVCPKLNWMNSHFGNSKKSILNFWPIWSLSMCWVAYKEHHQL